MKKPIPFTILVPVVDMELDAESRHIGDMTVEATAYQYGDGSLLMDEDEEGRPDVDITLIWGLKNVTPLLSTLAPDFVWECRMAAAEHAKQYHTHVEQQIMHT